MSGTVKLAKEIDELHDIGLPTAECPSRTPSEKRRVTQRCDLRPAQGGAEDTEERVLVLHTEMCEKSESGRRRRRTPTPTGSPTPKPTWSPSEGSTASETCGTSETSASGTSETSATNETSRCSVTRALMEEHSILCSPKQSDESDDDCHRARW